jgi:hypothetical protein
MVSKILIVVVLVLIFFLLYSLFINTNKLLPIEKMKYHKIKTKNLSHIISNNYYFSMWYNIHGIKNKLGKRDSQVGVSKTYDLLKWIDQDYKQYECNAPYEGITKVYIGIDQNLNNLVVKLYPKFKNLNSPPSVNISINDVPLNGWNNIIVNLNHNIVDVFINGELRTTRLSQELGRHLVKGSNILCIGDDNLDGYVGNVTFGEDSISTEEAFNIYKSGLGQNPIKALFDKYRLKFAILEKSNELSSLEL